MTRRTKESYISLFNYIEENILKLEPDMIMTDYEDGLLGALTQVYPDATISGCWFHYSQALQRRCRNKEKSLYELIQTDARADRLFHKFLILPLLPQNKILEGFNLLVADSREYQEIFKSFIKYFKNIWMNKYGERICVYGKSQRTNNGVESFNGELKDSVRVAHGNFWRVVGKLKNILMKFFFY